MNATVNNVIQGRYGFHPCDHATYLKRKLIHKVYWQAIFAMAAWHRWDRKEPQNRVERYEMVDGKKKRPARGYERLVPAVPVPEPALPPWVKKFDHKKVVKTHVGDCKQYKGPIYEVVWHTIKLDPSVYSFVQDFQSARTPKIESQVTPLLNSPERIDAMYAQAQEWLGL